MLRLLPMSLLLLALPVVAAGLPNRPVAALDLGRYSGQWHEIAHLPMFLQRRCLDSVTATYTPQVNGSIQIKNSCRTRDGRKTIEGVAKVEDGQPAAFKVRFVPPWLGWLPMAWADYWVIDIDPDYQWAVVGSPNREHLWILSRSSHMERDLFDRIRQQVAQRGYTVDNLVVMAPLD